MKIQIPPWMPTMPGWSLPAPCWVCRAWSLVSPCAVCRARFARPMPRCRRCARVLGVPAAGVESTCEPCRRKPPGQLATVAAVDYTFPWNRRLAQWKFHDEPGCSGELAGLLWVAGACHPDWPAPGDPGLRVVPVPLAPGRLAERGFDQGWELARRLASRGRWRSSPRWLERIQGVGAHQVGAGRSQRLAQLRHAVRLTAAGRRELPGRRVLLVDDVRTTGATADAATDVLLAGGAAAVLLAVVARTAEPDGDDEAMPVPV